MLLGVLASLFSAALYTAAFPPYELSAVAWVVLVPLLLVLKPITAARRFLLGLLFGFGFALGVTSWSIHSIAAYFEIPRAAAAAVAAAMYLLYVAIYVGLFAVAAGWLMERTHWVVSLTAIPSLWVLYEYARTYAFAGLPWEFLAHSQYHNLPLIQIADSTGELGVSFVIVLVNVAIAETVRSVPAAFPFASITLLRKPALLLLAASAAVAGSTAYGKMRLAELSPDSEDVLLALVQANATRPRTPTAVDRAKAILAYVNTTTRFLDGKAPHLIVWPEYALDSYPKSDRGQYHALSQIAARARAGLIFGAPRGAEREGAGVRLYNSAYFMSQDGTLDGFYDKIRLLPFAEYTPALAAPLLPDREQDIFAAGSRPGVIDTGRAERPGILICYEALFPRLARKTVAAGADYLVNIANDGWLGLGESPAPHQYFSMLPFRAIENRVFVARASTTGISGILDPAGRTISFVETGRAGIALGKVGPPAARPFVLRWGDWFPLATFLWSAVALGIGLERRPERQ